METKSLAETLQPMMTSGEMTLHVLYVHQEIEKMKQTKSEFIRNKFMLSLAYKGKEYKFQYSNGKFAGVLSGIKKASFGDSWTIDNANIAPMTTQEALKKNLVKPVIPSIPDVVYCLASDAMCANDTFEDFCSNLGYDTDSRSALETYLACQKTKNELTKMFGETLLQELQSCEH